MADGMQKKNYNYTIGFIRILACALIVWIHTSEFMLDGRFNKLHFANIGVQIFFFMSGYLYSNKTIPSTGKWLKRNCLKIAKPYWLFLAVIIPLIMLLDANRLSAVKVIATFIGVQGFFPDFIIEGIGHLWFISYILLCYLLTPLLKKITHNLFGGGKKRLDLAWPPDACRSVCNNTACMDLPV